MRLDRLASLYLFGPLQKRGPQPRLPILMYHSISDGKQNGVRDYYKTATTPHIFAIQMAFLKANGYSAISFEEAPRFLSSPHVQGIRAVVLTFDDGFRDFYTNAFPIIHRHGFPATVFLPTAFIGETQRSFLDRECLTWAEIRELQRAGIDFGSHTVAHPQLRNLSRRDVANELLCSKKSIEDHLGVAVKSFSYPYAFPEQDHTFTAALRTLLQQTGYEQGVSTILGTARPTDDRLFLPRLPMNSSDDLALFQAKLNGGYDWLHIPQYWSKLTRGRPAAAPALLKIAT